MTTPDERTRAVLKTREFLSDLTSHTRTPDVPEEIREHAIALLRHYPYASDMYFAGHACPQWFGIPDEDSKRSGR